MSKKNTVIVVAYPDRGEGNDPELLFFFFFFRGVGSLSQPRLNIFTVDNMGVMICLGQGGLRSLSASSFFLPSVCHTTTCTVSFCFICPTTSTIASFYPLFVMQLHVGPTVSFCHRCPAAWTIVSFYPLFVMQLLFPFVHYLSYLLLFPWRHHTKLYCFMTPTPTPFPWINISDLLLDNNYNIHLFQLKYIQESSKSTSETCTVVTLFILQISRNEHFLFRSYQVSVMAVQSVLGVLEWNVFCSSSSLC